MQQHNFTTQNYAVGFGKRITSAIALILRISPAKSFPNIVPLLDQTFLFPSLLLAKSRICFFFDFRYSVTKITDRVSFDLHGNTFLAVSGDLNATNTGAGRFFAFTMVSESDKICSKFKCRNYCGKRKIKNLHFIRNHIECTLRDGKTPTLFNTLKYKLILSFFLLHVITTGFKLFNRVF